MGSTVYRQYCRLDSYGHPGAIAYGEHTTGTMDTWRQWDYMDTVSTVLCM